MEYSPECAIPYLSRVDAGTVDFIRRLGVARRLVGRSRPAIRSGVGRGRDRDPSRRLRRSCIASRTARSSTSARSCRPARRRPSSRCSRRWSSGSARRGSSPTARRSSAPRRTPAIPTTRRHATNPGTIRPNELLLLDLWGKLDQPGAVYADITWRLCRHAARGDRQGVRRGGRRHGTRRSRR